MNDEEHGASMIGMVVGVMMGHITGQPNWKCLEKSLVEYLNKALSKNSYDAIKKFCIDHPDLWRQEALAAREYVQLWLDQEKDTEGKALEWLAARKATNEAGLK